MANVVKQGLEDRENQLKTRMGSLAYEYYRLTNQLKAIEAEIGQLECAKGMNDLTRKDVDTEAAIVAAQTKAKENDG